MQIVPAIPGNGGPTHSLPEPLSGSWAIESFGAGSLVRFLVGGWTGNRPIILTQSRKPNRRCHFFLLQCSGLQH